MTSDAVLNVRLPKNLKEHGNQVLSQNGMSVSKVVRRLYEYLEQEQRIPDVLVSQDERSSCEGKRRLLREMVGIVDLPDDYDARREYREYQLRRY